MKDKEKKERGIELENLRKLKVYLQKQLELDKIAYQAHCRCKEINDAKPTDKI